jgi:putative thioredoxin
MIDFQREVIDRSYEMPVVVDFWAPWCAPCRVLGPVIEQIAAEQAGQWDLVKVNTEDQPDISDQYAIRSIPNVKIFYRGEVIDEFSGALPRNTILAWLKDTLPKPGLLALDKLLEEKEVPEVADLEMLAAQFPETPEINIVWSQLILWDAPEKVHGILEFIKMGTPYYDKAGSLRDIASFLLHASDDLKVNEVRTLMKNGSLDLALPEMIAILGKDSKAMEGLLAKAAIGIFNTLGTQHPLTKTYRKQLDMVLWV